MILWDHQFWNQICKKPASQAIGQFGVCDPSLCPYVCQEKYGSNPSPTKYSKVIFFNKYNGQLTIQQGDCL